MSANQNDPVVTLSDGLTELLSDYLAQGPMVVTPDGQSMTENAFFYYNRGYNPSDWITYADGEGKMHIVLLSDYLAQGPVVITPDGQSMTENAFFYYNSGYNPGDWITYTDGQGKSRVELLSSFLAEGPNDPMVITPDGKTMTVNAFFYYNSGYNPSDWITYTDGQGKTRIELKSQFAQQGPTVTTPDGQQMPQGEFVLTHPNTDPNNPWVFVPYQGQEMVMPATDFQVSIDEMMALGNAMSWNSGDVNNVFGQLEADLTGIENTFAGLSDPNVGQQLYDAWTGANGTLATLVQGGNVLAQSLRTMSQGLADSARAVAAMEQANLPPGSNVTFTVPQAPRNVR
jgi:hypothetical protein